MEKGIRNVDVGFGDFGALGYTKDTETFLNNWPIRQAVGPSASFDFTKPSFGGAAIDPRITFTRNSVGTYFDNNGVLQTASANIPRIDYDPVSKAIRGLLIEEQRTNLIINSNDLTQANWAKAQLTITASAGTGLNPTLPAQKLVEDNTLNIHSVKQSFTITAGQQYTFFGVFRAVERTIVRIVGISSSLNVIAGTIDLTTGVVTLNNGTGGSINLGNGNWLFWLSGTPSVASFDVYMEPALSNNTFNYQGDGVSGLMYLGSQLELGAFPTSYIPTAGSAVTRQADLATVSNITGFVNPQALSYMVSGITPPGWGASSSGLVSFDGATLNDRVTAYGSSGNNIFLAEITGGVNGVSLSQSVVGNLTPFKTAGSIDGVTAYISNNGAAPTSGPVTQPMPPFTKLSFGNRGGSGFWNGWISRVDIYSQAVGAGVQRLSS